MVATDSAGGRGSSEEALASSFECARVRQSTQQASRWSGPARARESQSAAETRSASRRTGSHSRARTDGGLLAVHDGCPPHVRVMYSLAPPLRPPTECAVSPRALRTPRPILYPPPRAHSAAADSGHRSFLSSPCCTRLSLLPPQLPLSQSNQPRARGLQSMPSARERIWCRKSVR